MSMSVRRKNIVISHYQYACSQHSFKWVPRFFFWGPTYIPDNSMIRRGQFKISHCALACAEPALSLPYPLYSASFCLILLVSTFAFEVVYSFMFVLICIHFVDGIIMPPWYLNHMHVACADRFPPIVFSQSSKILFSVLLMWYLYMYVKHNCSVVL